MSAEINHCVISCLFVLDAETNREGEQVTHEATFGPSGDVLCNPILNEDLGQIISNAFPAASVGYFISRCRKRFDAGGCVTKLKGQY